MKEFTLYVSDGREFSAEDSSLDALLDRLAADPDLHGCRVYVTGESGDGPVLATIDVHAPPTLELES